MKRIKKIALIFLIIITPVIAYPFPTGGETTFDLGIYAGYNKDKDTNASGSPMGIFGGISFGVTLIRASVFVYSDSTMLDKFSRTSMGLIGRFQADTPAVQPYFKAGFGIIDVFSNVSENKRDYFTTYVLGAGLEMGISIVKPFVDYSLWNSSFNGSTIKNYAITFGVRIAM